MKTFHAFINALSGYKINGLNNKYKCEMNLSLKVSKSLLSCICILGRRNHDDIWCGPRGLESRVLEAL